MQQTEGGKVWRGQYRMTTAAARIVVKRQRLIPSTYVQQQPPIFDTHSFLFYAGVTLDQIPCGSPADTLRIPLELEHTLGRS